MEYSVTILGPLPADIVKLISKAHAAAIRQGQAKTGSALGWKRKPALSMLGHKEVNGP